MSYLSEHEVVVDLGVDITSIKDRNKYLENTKKLNKKIKYSEEEILKQFFNKYPPRERNAKDFALSNFASLCKFLEKKDKLIPYSANNVSE